MESIQGRPSSTGQQRVVLCAAQGSQERSVYSIGKSCMQQRAGKSVHAYKKGISMQVAAQGPTPSSSSSFNPSPSSCASSIPSPAFSQPPNPC
eukprot:scaffold33311_cov19-Tisochrysis_lutea.AAC.1